MAIGQVCGSCMSALSTKLEQPASQGPVGQVLEQAC